MRRVVKIGGSLLLRPCLNGDLSQWLSSQPNAQTLVIVGGGELIDSVRKLDQVQPADSAVIHWRCVDLLQTTFQFVRDWFPDWSCINTAAEFQTALQVGFSPDRPTLIAVSTFYRPENDQGLPKDWRTTTDAIAALLAIQSSADELVLLKSCEVDDTVSIQVLEAMGIVDGALPPIADQVTRIRVERLNETSQES